MVISSRTPEGTPNRCPVCGTHMRIEPSAPSGDAPCPCCGHLVWFTWEDLGDIQVIKPTDSLLTAESLDQLFKSQAMRPRVHLVIDFNDVQYFSSAVLGTLINIKKKVAAVQGTIRLRGIPTDLLTVFRVTRLDEVFAIEE